MPVWLVRAGAVLAPALLGVAGLRAMGNLQGPTVAVYSGLTVALFGLVSTARIPRWLGLRRRVQGLMVTTLGVALAAGGLAWPARLESRSSVPMRLNRFLPRCHFYEHHQTVVRAPLERVREALDAVELHDIAALQSLARIRSVVMGHGSGEQPEVPRIRMMEAFSGGVAGFFALDQSETERVFGLAGQPWNNAAQPLPDAQESFAEWCAPGSIKAAFNFKAADQRDGTTLLTTETRVLACDDSARRTMGMYWRLIYPGSGLIRVGLLDAVRRRAEADRPF